MNLVYRVDVSTPQARFAGIEARAQDTERILNRWGGYFRSEARRKIKEGNFEPLAESTRKKLEQTRTAAVTDFGKLRKSYVANLTGYLRGRMRAGNIGAAADLAELQRLAAGGEVHEADRWVKEGGTTKAIARVRAQIEKARRTGRRVGGNKRKISRHKILGRLDGSILWKIEGNTVKDLSRVPWSGVHNLGGTVGHGAVLPPRTFLEVTGKDEAALAYIVIQSLMR